MPFVELLPDAVWGALVGAGIAYLGIAQRLRFDREERERERSHSLKREMLLQVADAIAGAQAFLTQFGQPGLSPQQHEDSIRGLASRLERAQLAGEPATVEALSRATSFFDGAATELALVRTRIESLELKLQSRESEREGLQQYQGNLATLVRNTPPQPKAPVPTDINHALKILQDTQIRLEKLDAEIEELAEDRQKQRLQLARLSIEKAIGFQRTCIPAKVLIRRELGTSPDTDEFEQILENALSRRQGTLSNSEPGTK